jgi:catechol 2,3-dioxygenase-like lactoylglutathione lyase family enzyme
MPEAIDFFVKFFSFELIDQKGDFVAILSDGDGFTLVLTKNKADTLAYPPDFHFGFLQNTEEQVFSIYNKLIDGGLDIPAPKSIRGSLGFYFNGPDGILMEVSCA